MRTIDPLFTEIMEKYWEWLEMGHPLDDLLFALLKKEIERREFLEWKLDYANKQKIG